VVYAAKSTEDRRGSIPEQLRDCREVIEGDPRRRVVAEYTDEAFSAYRRDRGPGLVDAMQHAEDLAVEFGISELWAQHSDRLARGDGRSARHTVEIALWALKHDVRVRALQDPETFRDLLYAVVTGQRNNEDSKRKGLSSQAGRKRAIARGEYLGHIPDGYRLHHELLEDGTVLKRMVLDPARQEIIEMVFRLSLRGRTCGQIAASLNRRGWVTKPVKRKDQPRPFCVRRVYETLRNPRYAALAPYEGEILARGHWPAYVTERQHERILSRLTAAYEAGRPRMLVPFLLAGVIRCGHCGHSLHALSARPHVDGSYVRRYHCSSHVVQRGPAQCMARPLAAHTVEAMLVANLETLLPDTNPNHPQRRSTVVPDEGDLHLRLREAAIAGDDREVDAAVAALFARLQPYAAMVRDTGIAQRRARELSDAERLRAWIERDPTGHADHDLALELKRLIRGWFEEVTVKAEPKTITITATRRQGSGPPAPRVEVSINRAAWARSAPVSQRMAHGTWEHAEILGALQAWADEHGRSPEQKEWKHASAEHPEALTVRKHVHNNWNTVLRKAGLDPVTPPKIYEWTPPEIIKALQAWTRKHGRPPYAMEWAKAQPGYPCAATIREHYGHWDDALHAAGLKPMRPAKHRLIPWPRAQMIQALQTWATLHGRPPHGLDWIKAKPEHPSAGTIYNHYGTWNKALTAAGLPPYDPRPRIR
jgi:hypothetical protein